MPDSEQPMPGAGYIPPAPRTMMSPQGRQPTVSGSGSAKVQQKPALEQFHDTLIKEVDYARNLQNRICVIRNRLETNLTGSQIPQAPDSPESDMGNLPGVIGHLHYSLQEMGSAVEDLERLI